MFAYCENGPVVYSDYTGHYCCLNLIDAEEESPAVKAAQIATFLAIKAMLSRKNISIVFISESNIDNYKNIRPAPNSQTGITTLYVADCRTNDQKNKGDPNIRVINSGDITSSNIQKLTCMYIKAYCTLFPSGNNPEWNRSIDQMCVEWDAHNDINDLYPNERCQHVDFNNNDEETSYLGYWIRAAHDYIFG